MTQGTHSRSLYARSVLALEIGDVGLAVPPSCRDSWTYVRWNACSTQPILSVGVQRQSGPAATLDLAACTLPRPLHPTPQHPTIQNPILHTIPPSRGNSVVPTAASDPTFIALTMEWAWRPRLEREATRWAARHARRGGRVPQASRSVPPAPPTPPCSSWRCR